MGPGCQNKLITHIVDNVTRFHNKNYHFVHLIITKYFMHKIFSMISKQKILITKFTILLRTASWDQVNTTELVYVFNTYLAAVDWLGKRLLQTHVMIIVDVREEVRGTLGNNTIAERIYGEHSTYNTRCNMSTVNTVPTTPDVTRLQ